MRSDGTRGPEPSGQPGSFCLLVSSCDAYEDCWQPFFTLLAKFWQTHGHTIFLNTETKAFAFEHLDIRCPRVELSCRGPLPWSERLLRCLEVIPYDVVLYMQEDYFLNDVVDVRMIEDLADLMQRSDISHISLDHQLRPGRPSPYPLLSVMDRDSEYLVSTQAGLWNVSALRSSLRRHETVWAFEWYGTRRARRRGDVFFYVNGEYERAHGKKVVPYTPTGVIHGRWLRRVVEDLFRAHGICVDYSVRGFYDPANDELNRPPLLTRAVHRLRSTV